MGAEESPGRGDPQLAQKRPLLGFAVPQRTQCFSAGRGALKLALKLTSGAPLSNGR